MKIKAGYRAVGYRAAGYVVLVLLAYPVFAQQTGGVFPPVVNDGHRSYQYRSAYNAGTDGFAQRLHYQQALDGDFMWRVLGQTRKTDDSDFDFDFLQAELFWELSGDDPNYRRGVRFDVRVRDDDRPHQIGFNWIHQFHFYETWTARTILLTTLQFGENSVNGVGLQTRASIAKRLPNKHTLGLEWFSAYGTTSDFESLSDQSHAVGPMYSFPVAGGWSVFAGALFGVTSSAPDTEFRLWLTRFL